MKKTIKALLYGCVGVFLSCAAQAEFSRSYLDQHPLNTVSANGIELSYRMVGDPQHPMVLMVMGLGATHVVWGDNMVKGLEDAGFQILLFDNRDVGGSTRFEQWGEPTLWWQLLKYTLGFEVDAPYNLYDMADDTIGLMDALNIQTAHVVGASMGGMIAQIIAARYPERATSLVSIMSTTNAPHLPRPSGDAESSLLNLAEGEAEEERAAEMRHRGFSLEGMPRQIMSILKTGDRTLEVATIKTPTLVLHGEDDALLQLAHGQHTAQTIKGSKFVTFANMQHNIPDDVLPKLIDVMVNHLKGANTQISAKQSSLASVTK